MANSFQVNAYQITPTVVHTNGVISKRIGFPTSGFGQFQDCSGSPDRSLPTGVSVYSVIIDSRGISYYLTETVAQLATLIG